MGEVNKSANLVAYCAVILAITIGIFSLSFWDESFDEDWYREHSVAITAGAIIFCLISLGYYFKKARGGGFIDSRIVLFIAILGYLFDWVSLTNDITRFTEEDKYNWGGQQRSFVTGQTGRINSTITGIAAMVADVFVLYSSSSILFGSKCVKCYKSGNYNIVVFSLMLGLILWSSYLIKKYPRIEDADIDTSEIQGSLSINTTGKGMGVLLAIQICILIFSLISIFTFKSQISLHISLVIIGILAIYILNGTESRVNLIREPGQTGSIRLLDSDRRPSSVVPYLFYGNNMTRARFNGTVIFLNILLGWQNFWYTYASDIANKTDLFMRTLNLVTTFVTDLVVPSLLNFINTNGQLVINAEDLKIPRDFDSDGNVEGFGAMAQVLLFLLFTIFIFIASSEKKINLRDKTG